MRKILIHSIVFSPDSVSTAYLYNDIAAGLKQNGFEVVVLTTTPHYNRVPEEIARQPLRKRFLGLYYTSEFSGTQVIHIPQRKFKSFIARSAGFVYWHILSFVIGLFQSRISLILSPSPPLTIGLVSLFLARLKGAKVVYNVQEIYPDFLINQGGLKSQPAIKLLKKLEYIVYNYSDAVTTIDRVFYNTIVPRFNDASKLVIIPNFVDTDIYKSIENPEKFLDSRIFPGKPVLKLMYAGNIGHAQDWDPLLLLAEKFLQSSVEFWVVGEGVLKDKLRDEINHRGLHNVHLLPYQHRELMPYLLSYADIHFIFMNSQMDKQGFPSKVYTIMACEKPLLVISGEETPLYQFLKDKQCAYLISEGDSDARQRRLQEILHGAMIDRESYRRMGSKGHSFIDEHYSKKVVVSQYIELINRLLN